MNRMRHYILVLIFLISVLIQYNVFGQFSYSVHYSDEDNLPSSKVYDMLEGSQGLMWFATEDGVSNFDGYTFSNYSHRNGLPSNSIIKLYEDFKGRIWFLSYKGEVSYFENDTIIPHWINPYIVKERLRMFDHIDVDTASNLFLSGAYGGWIQTNEKEHSYSAFFNNTKQRRSFNYTVYFNPKPDKNIIGFFYDKIPGLHKLEQTYPGLSLISFGNKKFYSYLQKQKLCLGDETCLISLGPILVYSDGDTIYTIKEFEGNIIAMAKDQAGNIWISEEFEATYQYKNGNLNNEPITHFPNLSISKILVDHEGSYWFSSTENGVFMVPGIQFKTYFKSMLGTTHDMIISLEHDEERLYFSTGNRGVFAGKIKAGNFVLDKDFIPEGKKPSNAKDILTMPDGSIWITGGEHLRFDKQGNHLPVIKEKKYSGYNLSLIWENKIAMATMTGYTLFDINGIQISTSEDHFNQRSFVISEANDSALLIGTINGLYLEKNGVYNKITKPEALKHRIATIVKTGSISWIGTFDYGLVVCYPDTFYTITTSEGLAGNRVKAIFAESEERIWVGTNKGLSRIDWNADSASFALTNFSIWDGLPSNEINDIISFDNLLWLATGNGLVSFESDLILTDQLVPDILLESVIINDDKNYVHQNGLFKFNENNLTFNFRAHTFKNCLFTKYLYRLEGLEDQWIETSNHNIRYSGLEAGNYTFMVKAELYNGKISEIKSYSFEIKKHFANTFIFKAALFISILFLLFTIVLNYNKNNNKRRKLERQILLAEQNAVRAQMNPHFIFNSLNSIQNFILDKDDKNANLYLVIFSSLIRKILEASKQNFISLREEVETIKLYLELEKFRFENQFEFVIKIDPKVNAEGVAIPSMILQPFLENAIWHGLVPKKGKGQLQLDVNETERGFLLISITDNGIGREKAAVISKRRKHHKPTGMKNVKERLNLLNQMNDTHMTIEVIDLYNKESEGCGTRIEFLIDV